MENLSFLKEKNMQCCEFHNIAQLLQSASVVLGAVHWGVSKNTFFQKKIRLPLWGIYITQGFFCLDKSRRSHHLSHHMYTYYVSQSWSFQWLRKQNLASRTWGQYIFNGRKGDLSSKMRTISLKVLKWGPMYGGGTYLTKINFLKFHMVIYVCKQNQKPILTDLEN